MPHSQEKEQEVIHDLCKVCEELAQNVKQINDRLDNLEADKKAFMDRTSIQFAHLCDLEEKAILKVAKVMEQDSALRSEIGLLTTLYRQHDMRAEKYIDNMSEQVKKFTTVFFVGTGAILTIQTINIVMAITGGN